MSFEPVFETININCKKFEILEQIKADCRTEIPTEEVGTVLSVSAFASVSDNQIQDGRLNYFGKVVFYISYIDAQGKLKKCECGNEFKGVFNDERVSADLTAFVFASVDKCEYDLSGIKLGVNAFVSVSAEVSGAKQCRALSHGENIVVNSNEVKIHKSYGVKTLNFPIDEQYELSYPVEEVLTHRAEAVITAVQCGVGSIIVDGEVYCSAILLQKTEKNDIIKENRAFPFRAEIECEDATPDMHATVKVKEKSFKIDITVDENSQKSVVSVSVHLIFQGEAFLEEGITVVSDAFSTEQEVELIKEETAYYKKLEQRSINAVVSGRAVVEELPVGAVVFAVGGEKAEVFTKNCSGENTIVTGIVSAIGFFRDGEGKTFTKNLQIPFECVLDCAFGCDAELSLIAKPINGRAKIVTLNEIELDCDLTFTLFPNEKKAIKLVSGVKPIKEKVKNDCALSVYIALEGEELFSLAKRLNVCPDDLAQSNKDLQFPLTGNERIVIYRQK